MNHSEAWAFLNSLEVKPNAYHERNLKRYLLTIDWIPQGKLKLLDIGSDQFFLALVKKCRPEIEIHTCNLELAIGVPEATNTEPKLSNDIDCQYFNVEKDTFPYPDESFDFVCCLEVIEHLLDDPAFMTKEINRILKSGGQLLLTTPNLMSWQSILDSIKGIYPMEHMKYHKSLGFPQHIREFFPYEIVQLLKESGFLVDKVKTYEVTKNRKLNIWERLLTLPLYLYIILLIRHPKFLQHRGPKAFFLSTKQGVPKEKAGSFLYLEEEVLGRA